MRYELLMDKKLFSIGILGAAAVIGLGAFALAKPSQAVTVKSKVGTNPGDIYQHDGQPLKPVVKGDKLAAFSEGCFWGSENVFRHVRGVVATAVGFTGGHVAYPTYQEVCTHTTGHAETVLLEFNPRIVSYQRLLYIFWNSHNPTEGFRQGPDFGSNYRSAIWTFSPKEYMLAVESRQIQQKGYTIPITTQISPIGPFWLAEKYHQQYDEKNGVAACPVFLRKQAK